MKYSSCSEQSQSSKRLRVRLGYKMHLPKTKEVHFVCSIFENGLLFRPDSQFESDAVEINAFWKSALPKLHIRYGGNHLQSLRLENNLFLRLDRHQLTLGLQF